MAKYQKYRWQNYSYDQLKDFYYTSKDLKDFSKKVGYTKQMSNNAWTALEEQYPEFSYTALKEKKLEDLTGKTFNYLTVLGKDLEAEDKQTHWLCQCRCGKIVSVRNGNLKNGNTKSCGCLKKDKQIYDLTGQRFGSLVCQEYITLENGVRGWKCKCDCGNSFKIRTTELVSGHRTSCGCRLTRNVRLQKVDLTGQIFGKLKAIERDNSKTESKKVFWLCQCECGKIVSVQYSNLITGNTKSCGCLKSKGENKIQEILLKLKIPFEREYYFEDLIGLKGGVLRFDFWLPEFNILLEYQGEQHYTSFWGEEMFLKQQQHDSLKREYCKNHNLTLIEIPYWDFEKINEEYIKNILDNFQEEK